MLGEGGGGPTVVFVCVSVCELDCSSKPVNFSLLLVCPFPGSLARRIEFLLDLFYFFLFSGEWGEVRGVHCHFRILRSSASCQGL